MSLRKKACTACALTKRRCDQGLPACHRCTKRSLYCQYPNPPISSKSTVLSQPAFQSSTTSSANVSTPTPEDNHSYLLFDNNTGPANFSDIDTSTGGGFQEPEDLELWNKRFELDFSTGLWQSDRSDENLGAAQEFSRHESDFRAHDAPRSRRYFDERVNFSQEAGFQTDSLWPCPLIISASLSPPAWSGAIENDTWRFCASELLSYIKLFAKTATTPFIGAPDSRGDLELSSLHPSLRNALGVCAMHTLNKKDSNHLSEQLLALELKQLVESSASLVLPCTTCSYNTSSLGLGLDSSTYIFRQELARLQAVTLYQIIRYFNKDPKQRSLAEQQEPLIVSWTTSLQLRLQTLGQHRAESIRTDTFDRPDIASFPLQPDSVHTFLEPTNWSQSESSSYEVDSVQQEEIENAHRTILMSYFVRGVYTFLRQGFCPFLTELGALKIHLPPYYQGIPDKMNGPWSILPISYDDLVGLWSCGGLLKARIEDRFIGLLLVACKGMSVLDT